MLLIELMDYFFAKFITQTSHTWLESCEKLFRKILYNNLIWIISIIWHNECHQPFQNFEFSGQKSICVKFVIFCISSKADDEKLWRMNILIIQSISPIYQFRNIFSFIPFRNLFVIHIYPIVYRIFYQKSRSCLISYLSLQRWDHSTTNRPPFRLCPALETARRDCEFGTNSSNPVTNRRACKISCSTQGRLPVTNRKRTVSMKTFTK